MDFHQSVCVALVQLMQALDCLDFFKNFYIIIVIVRVWVLCISTANEVNTSNFVSASY